MLTITTIVPLRMSTNNFDDIDVLFAVQEAGHGCTPLVEHHATVLKPSPSKANFAVLPHYIESDSNAAQTGDTTYCGDAGKFSEVVNPSDIGPRVLPRCTKSTCSCMDI